MKRPHDGVEGDAAGGEAVSPTGEHSSPAQPRRRKVAGGGGAPTSSAAVASDYVGLCCARRRGGSDATVVDFGVVLSTRAGTLGQQWSVFWQAAGAAEEYRWAGLKQCLLTLNNLLEEGGPQAEAARDACTAVAAAARSAPGLGAQAGGTSRPHRERVRSVRAPALADTDLAVIGFAGVPEPSPTAAPSWMAARAQAAAPLAGKAHPSTSSPSSAYGHEGHAVAGHKPPASGFKGVYRSRHGRGGFRAEGKIKGRSFSVGSNYETAEEAARAYDDAARAHGIPEERLNFPRAGGGGGGEGQAAVRSSPGPSSGTPGRRAPMSGFKGVYRARHRSTGWRAEFVHCGVKMNLGSDFETAEEAALAYDNVARSHGIPEERLNFPKVGVQPALGGETEAPESAMEAPVRHAAPAAMEVDEEEEGPPGWDHR